MATFTFFGYGSGEVHGVTNNILSQFIKHSTSMLPNKVYHLNGPGILGREVAANAQVGADAMLEWLKNQDDEQNTINMTGFSRGSITCIRIANHLKNKQLELERLPQPRKKEDEKLLVRLKKIDLNLFLLDPVAGLTDKSHVEGRKIPDNVKNCVVTLQKDERRRDFKPQDMTRMFIADPEKTKVSMLPMYGNHSDNGKIKKPSMDSGPRILWYALYGFLTQHGSEFNKNEQGQMAMPQIVSSSLLTADLSPVSKPQELLKIFSVHHNQRKAYYESGLTTNKPLDGIPSPRTKRALNEHTRYYVKHSNFFVNQLERELFKLSYPKTFNYLFEKNIEDPRFPGQSHCLEGQVIEELKKIQVEDPSLFKRLKARGVGATQNGINLGNPQGYNTLEPCATMQQLFPEMVPESVKSQAQEMNKLAELEQEIYRITFQYQREKSEFNFAGKRGKFDYALRLREEVNHIINNSPLRPDGTEDRESKYQKVLSRVEHHYKQLILSTSTSQLNGMLKELLADHGRKFTIKQASMLNQNMLNFIHNGLKLVSLAVEFVGHLGYVGGSVLFALGSGIESIGKRVNDLLGEIDNPLKAVAFVVASLVEGIGCLIKNSFGLKPITDFLVSGIKEARDCIIRTLNTTTIERKMEETLQQVVCEDIDPVLVTNGLSEFSSTVTKEHAYSYREQLKSMRQFVQPDPAVDDNLQTSIS